MDLTIAKKPDDLTIIQQRIHQYTRKTMPHALIATLWIQLTDIYGHRFMNTYGEKDSGVWYQALSDLTEDDLSKGLTLMMRDIRFETWPPNCTQFRHLCLSTKEPLAPKSVEAFREIRQNRYCLSPQWSHPAIKLAIKCMGTKAAYAEDDEKAYQAFLTKYTQICERMADGHPIPHVADSEINPPQFKREPSASMSQNIKALLASLKSPSTQRAIR